MILKRKLLSLSTIGAAALLISGPSLAGPPGGFHYGNYTVTGGSVDFLDGSTGDCPTLGATCVDLVNDTGIRQRQVTLSTGEQYIQTVVVDNVSTGSGLTAIDQPTTATPGVFNLDFTNETFVGTNAQAGDMATQGSVSLIADTVAGQGPAPSGSMNDKTKNFTVANIDQGTLLGVGEASAKIEQQQTVDNAGGSLKFWLASNGSESDRYMRMDQVVGAEPGSGGHPGAQGLTVRRSSGTFTDVVNGTLDLPPGSPDGGSSLTYAIGDDIGVVWLQLQNMGGAGLPGGSNDAVLQMQSFTNNGTVTTPLSDFKTWNTCASGTFGACNNVLASGSTWTYWDANFGSAPVAIEGTTNNNPPGDAFFPNFPN